jgi:hypothetical protein
MSDTGGVDRLESRTFAVFDRGPGGSLGNLCRALLSAQKETWADCRIGYDGLQKAKLRTIDCAGFSVTVQQNPGRAVSTEARVGDDEVARRPCFLCSNRIPRDQKLVRYGADYMILCNPMPVFPEHLTVAAIGHEPQAIDRGVGTFLRLIEDFSDDWTVLYNGPRCGASAPDHLHLQVVTGRLMPIEEEICRSERLTPVMHARGVSVSQSLGLGRQVIVMQAGKAEDLASPFAACVKSMRNVSGTDGRATEPMMNLVGFRRNGVDHLVIFPRRAHRPAAFFLEGEERIVVSPAVAEMGGIIVTPVERDFVRLTPEVVRGIYGEVSLEAEMVGRAMDALTGL